MTKTSESTTPSPTRSTSGTFAALATGSPGTVTNTVRDTPESGATRATAAENSITTRVAVGEAHERTASKETAALDPSAPDRAGPSESRRPINEPAR